MPGMSHLHERMCGVVGSEYSILWALSRFFARRSGGVSQGFGQTLSEAGFTGLLGIFGIAGDRLIPVERILFSWSERGRLQRDDYLGCATRTGSVPDFLVDVV